MTDCTETYYDVRDNRIYGYYWMIGRFNGMDFEPISTKLYKEKRTAKGVLTQVRNNGLHRDALLAKVKAAPEIDDYYIEHNHAKNWEV